MTKTLTEQWRNGTLEESMYYVKLPEEIIIANIYQLKQLDFVNDADEIEVLAPVPTYDEYKRLQKRIEIETKALKEIQEYTKEYSLPSYTGMICHKTLKEIDLVGTSTKGE